MNSSFDRIAGCWQPKNISRVSPECCLASAYHSRHRLGILGEAVADDGYNSSSRTHSGTTQSAEGKTLCIREIVCRLKTDETLGGMAK